MRKGFMNHWIILYSGTYVYEGGGIKKIREIIKQNSINKRIFNNKTRKDQSK